MNRTIKTDSCQATMPFYSLWVLMNTYIFFSKTNSDWSEFLSRSPEKYNIKLPQLPNGRGRYLYFDVEVVWIIKDILVLHFQEPMDTQTS